MSDKLKEELLEYRAQAVELRSLLDSLQESLRKLTENANTTKNELTLIKLRAQHMIEVSNNIAGRLDTYDKK